MNSSLPESPSFAELRSLFGRRIAVLDGAMGTMIQACALTEADFRGDRFRPHTRDLQGNNDLLAVTQPAVIERIHGEYFAAGADLVETNTFNANALSQADYDTVGLVPEINAAAAAAASPPPARPRRPPRAAVASWPARWGRPAAPSPSLRT